jgi:hypothetical protein
MLMLVSKHPVTARQLNDERIHLIEAVMGIHLNLNHDSFKSSDSCRRNHAKLKRFLRERVSEGFEVTEVEGFTIV